MTTKDSFRTPMGRVRHLGSANSGTGHFIRQRFTAITNALLVVPFVYLVARLAGLERAALLAELQRPLVALVLLGFLLSATYHMRIGVQVVIEDYVHGEVPKMAALALNTVFALAVAGATAFALLKIAFS